MKHKSDKHNIFKYIILLVVIAMVGCGVNSYLQYNVFYPMDNYDIVEKQAVKYDIDPFLIMSVIKAESNFKPDAISNKDAIGLMQITPSTAVWVAEQMELGDFKLSDLENPDVNIKLGVWYIDYLLDYYNGNTKLALAAYNAGTGTVDKWIANNQITVTNEITPLPYKETNDYLIKINTYYERYKQLY